MWLFERKVTYRDLMLAEQRINNRIDLAVNDILERIGEATDKAKIDKAAKDLGKSTDTLAAAVAANQPTGESGSPGGQPSLKK